MVLNKLRRWCALGTLCLVSAWAQAATTAQIDAVRAKGLAWLVSHQNSEGAWAAPIGLEIAVASEAMLAMGNAGMKGMPYGRATSWVQSAQANSVDSLSRKIVALQKGGHDVAALAVQLASWRTGVSLGAAGVIGGGWGAYDHFDASNPDTAFALGSLRLSGFPSYEPTTGSGNRKDALCLILGSQQTDGSWSYVLPAVTNTPALYKTGAVVPTVANILEIAELSNVSWVGGQFCGKTLTTTLTNAAKWLTSTKKRSDGGYGDSVSSAIDTALVYRALTDPKVSALLPTLAATEADAALGYLILNQSADGSWAGDAFSTATVLASLRAPTIPLIDTDADGVPDVVEAILGTSGVAAGRSLAGGGIFAPVKTLPTLTALPAGLARINTEPARSPQTIAFSLPSALAYSTTPINLVTAGRSSSGLRVSFASTTPSVCTVSGTNVVMVATGTCTVTASQTGNAQYAAATSVTKSVAIIAVQTITFNLPSNLSYSTTPINLATMGTSSSGLPVSFSYIEPVIPPHALPAPNPAACTVSGTHLTMVTKGTCTVRASQAGNAQYAAATAVTMSVTITGATQTITFNPPSTLAYSTTPISLATLGKSSSGLSVSYVSATPAVCTVSGTNLTTVNRGTCTVTVSQAGNAQYAAATSVTMSVTITGAAQTITISPASTLVYSTTPISLATLGKSSSGLPVSYVSTTPAVCTVSSTHLTLVAKGTCKINATQGGNAQYAAAASVSKNFAITGATLLGSLLPVIFEVLFDGDKKVEVKNVQLLPVIFELLFD